MTDTRPRPGGRDPNLERIDRAVVPESGRAPLPSEVRTLSSSDLLGEGGVVGIQHNGDLYILRRTRNGRLILTK